MPPLVATDPVAFAIIQLAILVAAAAITGLAVWGVRALLLRHRLLDRPNERSSHALPVPRGAGLAVVPVVLALWVLLPAASSSVIAWPFTNWIVVVSAIALATVSWRDDVRSLHPAVRLAAHFAAAIAGVAALPSVSMVFGGLLPPLADRALAVLVWVWFVNLFNFMDGIDGIAGVETVAIALGLALVVVWDGEAAPPEAVVLTGAALGFLLWNWHPARIFLGDVGSVPLGYLLGWLLLTLAAHGEWAAALILPAYYLADATFTLLARALAGEKVWQAHHRHFYQIALRGGAGHADVVRWIIVADALLIVFALVSLKHPGPALAGAALVVAALLAHFARMGRAPCP